MLSYPGRICTAFAASIYRVLPIAVRSPGHARLSKDYNSKPAFCYESRPLTAKLSPVFKKKENT